MKKLLISSLLLLLFASASVMADSISFNLTQPTAGYTFPGPYVEVIINLTSPTLATITFQSIKPGDPYVYQMLDTAAAGVNVNATNFSVSNITTPTQLHPPDGQFQVLGPPTVSNASNSIDGWGKFNLVLNASDGWGSAFDSFSFTVTNESGTWASAADVLIANATGAFAEAHVGPCIIGSTCNAANENDRTFVAAAIPEVTSLILFGSGLFVVGGIIRRKLTG